MPVMSARRVSAMGDGSRRGGAPALDVLLEDLVEDLPHPVPEVPAGEVGLELLEVADPPAVVAHARAVLVAPVELAAGDLLAERDRLEHRAVGLPPAAHIVDRG